MPYRFLASWFLLCCLSLFGITASAGGAPEQHTEIIRLVRYLLDSNPAVQSARSDLDAAKARERGANQPLYNPTLDLEAEESADLEFSVGVNQTVDWSDKRGARSGVAAYKSLAAEAKLHKIRQGVAAEFLTALVQFNIARSMLSISDEREKLMRQFASLAKQRRELGDLNQAEFNLAQLALAESRLQQAQVNGLLIDAGKALESVMGNPSQAVPGLPETFPPPQSEDADFERLLDTSPLIRMQKARIAAARETLKLRTLEQRPDPVIGVRIGEEESEFLAGVNVSIPLYVRNDFSAETDAAGSELLRVEQEAHDIHRRARAELVAGYEYLQANYRAWMDWQEFGAPSLQNRIVLLERLWRSGDLSTTDYLVQVRQALDTRIAAAELQQQLWLSWVNWLKVSGRVDAWLDQAGSL